jgi:hypothetical protein
MDQSAGPDIGVNLTEVAQHPETMWGETVTVSAAIDQLVSPHAMVIGNHTPIRGNTVLVLAAQLLATEVLVVEPEQAELQPGRVVQVRGVVRPFERETLERALGIDLAAVSQAGYGGSSVLVAEAIDLDVPIAAQAGDKELAGTSDGYDLGVTIEDVVRDPERYLGQRVTVSGEVEEHLLTPHAFLLDDYGLLAVSAAPRPELIVEATAYVEGEVRLFDVAQLESELGIDLDDALLAPYAGKPVIIVEQLVLVK